MKVFWMLVCSVFVLGGFALFAYAFQAEAIFNGGQPTDFPLELIMFFAGVVAVSIGYFIPFHLLEKAD